MLAALAVSRWIEHQTGWSIRRFVKTARRYRTIQISAGEHIITAVTGLAAADPRVTPLTSDVILRTQYQRDQIEAALAAGPDPGELAPRSAGRRLQPPRSRAPAAVVLPADAGPPAARHADGGQEPERAARVIDTHGPATG